MAGQQINQLQNRNVILTDVIPSQVKSGSGLTGTALNAGNTTLQQIKSLIIGGSNNNVIADGTTSSDATSIITLLTQITSTTSGTDSVNGVMMPSAPNNGDEYYIFNMSGNIVNLYSGDTTQFLGAINPSSTSGALAGDSTTNSIYYFKYINGAGWFTIRLQ